MKAALFTGVGRDLEHAEIDIDSPGAGQVLVDVKHCGVCHSDLHFIDGTMPGPVPIVLGHEAAGVVAEVGPGVTSVAPGDQVMLAVISSCNRCYFCVRGQHTLCVNSSMMSGHTFPDGSTGMSLDGKPVYKGLGVAGFAEQVLALEQGVVKIDSEIDLGVAGVIGCAVQTGVGAALNLAKVSAGSTVLVVGAGGIGVSIMQGARIAGAREIIVSDPTPERRAAAARFGATAEIDPVADDVAMRARALTGGIGVDYAFDAVGSGALVATASSATRMGGTVVCVGAAPLADSFDGINAVTFMFLQQTLMGCVLGGVNSARDVPLYLDLYKAGRLDLEGMITAHRPLVDVNAAVSDLQNGVGLRTMLDV